MKEEILNQFLEKALAYLNSAESFANREVPMYISELLHFKIMEHLFNGLTTTAVFMVLMGGFFSLLALSAYKDKVIKGSTLAVLIASSMLVSGILGAAASRKDYIQAYKAYSAPRVYLVEYLRGQK